MCNGKYSEKRFPVFGNILKMLFSYKFFTFSQSFSQLPNKFYIRNLTTTHTLAPTENPPAPIENPPLSTQNPPPHNTKTTKTPPPTPPQQQQQKSKIKERKIERLREREIDREREIGL